MKNFTITPKQAQSIIDVACSTWKTRLADKWSKLIVLNSVIEVEFNFYKDMKSACTITQAKLFDTIFKIELFEPKVGDVITVIERFLLTSTLGTFSPSSSK